MNTDTNEKNEIEGSLHHHFCEANSQEIIFANLSVYWKVVYQSWCVFGFSFSSYDSEYSTHELQLVNYNHH